MARMLSLFLLLGAALQLSAQAPGFDEYQVKAAFLYNFTKFVTWPAQSLPTPTTPIVSPLAGAVSITSVNRSISRRSSERARARPPAPRRRTPARPRSTS